MAIVGVSCLTAILCILMVKYDGPGKVHYTCQDVAA